MRPRGKCPARRQTTVTGLATSLLYVNKPPEAVEIQAKQLQNSISAEPKQEHVRLLKQDEHYPSTLKPLPHYEYCSTIEKDHFVLLSLTSPDSKKQTQILFQIDSAASCNTLPSKNLANMPWAKLLLTKTVILLHASPPIKAIAQVTLSASRGAFRCDLTLQVLNTDPPALLSTDGSKTLRVVAINADFVRKGAIINQ